MNKPGILIYSYNPEEGLLKEICAGIEEEGIPFEVVSQNYQDITALSYYSANDSILGTGIGISEQRCRLTFSNLPKDQSVFYLEQPQKHQARNLGANAARAVKKKAFKDANQGIRIEGQRKEVIG